MFCIVFPYLILFLRLEEGRNISPISARFVWVPFLFFLQKSERRSGKAFSRQQQVGEGEGVSFPFPDRVPRSAHAAPGWGKRRGPHTPYLLACPPAELPRPPAPSHRARAPRPRPRGGPFPRGRCNTPAPASSGTASALRRGPSRAHLRHTTPNPWGATTHPAPRGRESPRRWRTAGSPASEIFLRQAAAAVTTTPPSGSRPPLRWLGLPGSLPPTLV